MPKRKKHKQPIVATGQHVAVDIQSWSLDLATDKVEESYVAELSTESVTIQGFWDREDAICIVCRRSVDTNKETVATITTDTDPEKYIGVACRDCVLKALESAST